MSRPCPQGSNPAHKRTDRTAPRCHCRPRPRRRFRSRSPRRFRSRSPRRCRSRPPRRARRSRPWRRFHSPTRRRFRSPPRRRPHSSLSAIGTPPRLGRSPVPRPPPPTQKALRSGPASAMPVPLSVLGDSCRYRGGIDGPPSLSSVRGDTPTPPHAPANATAARVAARALNHPTLIFTRGSFTTGCAGRASTAEDRRRVIQMGDAVRDPAPWIRAACVARAARPRLDAANDRALSSWMSPIFRAENVETGRLADRWRVQMDGVDLVEVEMRDKGGLDEAQGDNDASPRDQRPLKRPPLEIVDPSIDHSLDEDDPNNGGQRCKRARRRIERRRSLRRS